MKIGIPFALAFLNVASEGGRDYRYRLISFGLIAEHEFYARNAAYELCFEIDAMTASGDE